LARNSVARTYTIDELMNADIDSDDEGYCGQASAKGIYPWRQSNYSNLFDKVSLKQSDSYPTALKSDHFVPMKPIEDKSAPPPQRILIVSPTANGIDHILDLLTPCAKKFKILRLGQSVWRNDLNKLFALNVPPKSDNSQQLMQEQIAKAQVVVTASFSLHSNALEKTLYQFDTVLIDDASMISEADIISSLRRDTKRAILFSNPEMSPGMFLINTAQA
jgi:hypothetical protein